MSGAWRVAGKGDGCVNPEQCVLCGNKLIARFTNQADARAVVAAHNAQGEAEPVAWQFRVKRCEQWRLWARWMCPLHDNEFDWRPLFAAPPPPVDALASVKWLRDTYAQYLEEDRNERPQRALYNVGRQDAADEIIRELEGGR